MAILRPVVLCLLCANSIRGFAENEIEIRGSASNGRAPTAEVLLPPAGYRFTIVLHK